MRFPKRLGWKSKKKHKWQGGEKSWGSIIVKQKIRNSEITGVGNNLSILVSNHTKYKVVKIKNTKRRKREEENSVHSDTSSNTN